MKEVKLGIIGLGIMGTEHINTVEKSKNIRLAAVCDIKKDLADERAKKNNVPAYYSANDLINSGEVDAVLIATPHYFHTPITIDAFEAGLHVISEKPIAVHKADAEKMIAAHAKHPKLVFSAMFQVRTDSFFKKIKEIIDSGELGEIYRVNWLITNWFRTQTYYNSGTWRATWKGEGGGVLLNQAPHQLDLFQWMFGMPVKVRAYCSLGKYHDIEVEDDVTAYCEFKEGFSGMFITSTGEAPGTNRLEIMADRGRLVFEDGKIKFDKTTESVSKFLKTTEKAFGGPKTETIEIETDGKGGTHQNIIENFADAVLNGAELVARGEEGINSVELANSFLYSALKDETVELPLDSGEFANLLNELIANSTFEKSEEVKPVDDITSSYNKTK
ncbi:MAG: gfo/Idh/MocA family oxidoreductase [Chlamydiae bacterium]|nr:MAG: gfo/Idh/MocA family oxidoreductase [Chlamydiota bacterium]